jgi:hypothetical protein
MPSTPNQPRLRSRHRARRAVGLTSTAAAVVALAACGGSSTGSDGGTTSSHTVASSDTAITPASSPSKRFASLRTCLKTEGIDLPTGPRGAQPSTGGPPTGGAPTGGVPGGAPGGARRGGFKLPERVSQSKFQEAIKKCGASGGFPAGGPAGFNSKTVQTALTKYTACMRENGVDLPAANTGGNGPIFTTKGIDTKSETFKNAEKQCRSDLPSFFRGPSPPAGDQSGPSTGGYGSPPADEGG